MSDKFEIVHFDEVDAVPCPCGMSRRAFVDSPDGIASIHHVDIENDARTHYHKKLTEIYLILECDADAAMELDGKRFAVRSLTTVLIRPGCRHRAIGRMKIVNIPIPAFDPDDEWFD